MNVREACVAGLFYPADAAELRAAVRACVGKGHGPPPKALVLPHAGYVYSGPIAGSGYRLWEGARGNRVVLLGPAHRYPLAGLAAHSAEWFETPLGRVPVDTEAVARLLELPQVRRLDAAHRGEHSLEVHIPFLQTVFPEFRLVPLVVGDAAPAEVAEVLERVWDGPETFVVVSSDLSHYHDYETARRLDRETANAIERLRAADVGPEDACGCRAIGGLLEVARRRGLRVTTLDLKSSGDTAGPRSEVVGYGAFAFA
ncbi:MAG TPA: AmmeMemoRadiSam system protein B [Planctomycetota bacterium]|nr:AmmeMemoRadiSam system protein B [Planctomycetota bacterium]